MSMLLDRRFWLFILVFILAVILVWLIGLSQVKKNKSWLSRRLYLLLILWTLIAFFFTVGCYLIFVDTMHSYLVLMLFFVVMALMILTMLSLFIFHNDMVTLLSIISWIILTCAVLTLNLDSNIIGFDLTVSLLLSFAFILLTYEKKSGTPLRLAGN